MYIPAGEIQTLLIIGYLIWLGRGFVTNNRNVRTKLYNLFFKVDGAITAWLIFCSVIFISIYGIFYDKTLTKFQKENLSEAVKIGLVGMIIAICDELGLYVAEGLISFAIMLYFPKHKFTLPPWVKKYTSSTSVPSYQDNFKKIE